MGILNGGNIQKGVVTYSSVEDPSTTWGTSLCIVNLRGLEGEGEYQGHPCENKRSAEYSAAEMFLESTAALMVDKEEERQAHQARRKEEQRNKEEEARAAEGKAS